MNNRETQDLDDQKWIHNELSDVREVHTLWGYGLILIGLILFASAAAVYLSGAAKSDLLWPMSVLASIMLVAAGIGKLYDAREIKRIIDTIERSRGDDKNDA